MIGLVAWTRAVRPSLRRHHASEETARLLASAAAGAGGLLAAALSDGSWLSAPALLLAFSGIALSVIPIAMGLGTKVIAILAATSAVAFYAPAAIGFTEALALPDRIAFVGLVALFVMLFLIWSVTPGGRSLRAALLAAGVGAITALVWPVPILVALPALSQGRAIDIVAAATLSATLVLAPLVGRLEVSRGMSAARMMDLRDGLMRVIGAAAALLASLWAASSVGSTLERHLVATPLEGLSIPAGWCAGGIVLAIIVWALFRVPRYLYQGQLKGRFYPGAISESIWFVVLVTSAGVSLDIAAGGVSLGWTSATALGAAGAYAAVRLGVPAPAPTGHSPLWIVLLQQPPWVGRALVSRLAAAWNSGPVTILAPPEAAPVVGGTHLRASATRGGPQHLFPQGPSNLVDWDNAIPPSPFWNALPVRELYAHADLWAETLSRRVTPDATVVKVFRWRPQPRRTNWAYTRGFRLAAAFELASEAGAGLGNLWRALLGLAGMRADLVAPSDAARLQPLPATQEQSWGATDDTYRSVRSRLKFMQAARPRATRHIMVLHHDGDIDAAASLCDALAGRRDERGLTIEAWPLPIDTTAWRQRAWTVPIEFWRHSLVLARRLLDRAAGEINWFDRLFLVALDAVAPRAESEYEIAVLEPEGAVSAKTSLLRDFLVLVAAHGIVDRVIALRSLRRVPDATSVLGARLYTGEIRWSVAATPKRWVEEVAGRLLELRLTPIEGTVPPDAPLATRRVATNIVLLSGGGRSVTSTTNLSRLSDAVDLAQGDQVAYRENGVGRATSWVLSVTLGLTGWGLKRRVLDLYMFACKNSTPSSNFGYADQIYAFGSGRGAFEIRVLISLIQDQGLITGVGGRELERQAKQAYRAYRRTLHPRRRLVGLLCTVRDRILRSLERRPPYTNANHVRPPVAFVGLWDTVDAYRLPIDEMTKGWDKWVWPLSLSDHRPSPIAGKICHAIALDDERQTFHPILFDESNEAPQTHTDAERVTQVWFAGVHSNVCGGYPDDSLAHVSLRWIAAEAAKKGLRLQAHMTAEWAARANPGGRLYDSRRGLGRCYRYNPRSMKRLTDDRFADVRVPLPKIHESVFARLAAGRDEYAPIVLPERYAVVQGDGSMRHGPDNPYEHPTQSQSRSADQERVWNLVWWRRTTYFATVMLTTLLIVAPFVLGDGGGSLLTQRTQAGQALVGLLAIIAPDVAQPWIEYYQEYSIQLPLGAALLAALLFLSSRIQQSIHDEMHVVWVPILKQPGTPVVPSAEPRDLVYRLRSSRAYRHVFDTITQNTFPFIFGFGVLAVLVLVTAGTANRAYFAVASAVGAICPDTMTPPAWDGSPTTVALPSRELCQATGLLLREGQSYRIEITLPKDDWRDSSIPVGTPQGFGSSAHPFVFLPILPFRRVLSEPWFVPMARVGSRVAEYHALNQGFAEFTPRRDGQLFLFVNDAIGVGPWMKLFYGNNRGTALVTVRTIELQTSAKSQLR